ncbi:MAG: N-formylglutamate amidohydrolase [Verrucomicrobia bacterium]|nr:N-formylglutamate amidohydrolase [Verrucomicrobiota bacterium]
MPPLRLLIVLLVLAAASPAPAAIPAPKVPGQSYFDTARHVEYIAGDLPLVLTVPHGGRAQPADLPTRRKGVTVMDANTQELARELVAELERLSGGRVHLILSHLHRSRLDPNREIVEAANGHPGAEQVWWEFHAAIEGALAAAVARHGFAFLVDLHGHSHPVARLELGYALAAPQLNRGDKKFDASGVISLSTLSDLHARRGGSAADLIRGPRSLGTLLAAGGLPATPSGPDPQPGNQPFFAGGYIVQRHAAAAGTPKVDGLQIECPRAGVRDTPENRARFGRITAPVLLEFLRENYGYAPAK